MTTTEETKTMTKPDYIIIDRANIGENITDRQLAQFLATADTLTHAITCEWEELPAEAQTIAGVGNDYIVFDHATRRYRSLAADEADVPADWFERSCDSITNDEPVTVTLDTPLADIDYYNATLIDESLISTHIAGDDWGLAWGRVVRAGGTVRDLRDDLYSRNDL